MNTLRIAQAALATILAVGINSTSYAFMAIDQNAEVQMDVTQMVDSFRAEIAAGETKCEEMLAKLDAALEDIEAKLDEGVANEDEYLAARDAIKEMRRDLECLGNQLTLHETGFSHVHQGGDGSGLGQLGSTGPFSTNPTGVSPVGGGGPITTSGTGTTGASGLASLSVVGATVGAVASNNGNRGFVASGSSAAGN